ncbi:MAG: GntR family transcriptional regulator [Spirochaetales bacterium]
MLDPNSSEPLYLQMANLLRNRILSGELKVNERIEPELELSQLHGLSRGTVREALDLLEEEGFLRRIQGKGTFVLHKDPRDKSSIIGVVMPYLKDQMIVRILLGLEKTLQENGYNFILCHSNSDLELERKQLERLQRQGTAGIILFPTSLQAEGDLVTNLLGENFPLVLVDRRIAGLKADFVGMDNFAGAYQAVSSLLDAGHQNIACVVPPDRPTSILDRIRGYETAMQDRGLFPLAAVSLAGSGTAGDDGIPHYSADDLAPIERLMNLKASPDALFCGNDFIAIGILHHLQEKGVQIPEDVALIGFDDTSYAGFPSVQLSTVSQPSAEIGRVAAELLLERIKNPELAARTSLLPGALVLRSSSRTTK